MAKKSRQRKFPGKQPAESQAGKIASSAPANNKPWWITAVCIALVLATAISYRGVRNNGFVTLDDNDYIVQNPEVQHGITAESIHWAFTAFHSANWHPLTWISHMIDWKLYGDNAGGPHITNLCLHCANAVLLFLLLLYMTGFIGRSAIVAFLFALHPAHVESVAWISERKDVLSTFFWFAALLAYAWYVSNPSWKRYALIIFAFACGLMSKPMVVTLPFTLLLLDYWPLRRISLAPESREQWLSAQGKLLVEKWPLFLMTIPSCILTFLAQKAGGSVVRLDRLPLMGRIANAAISFCRYVLLMFWPHPLSVYYYYSSYYYASHDIGILTATFSVLALLFVTALCWRYRKQRPYCLIGWLWFLGTLIPVIGIVQVGDQAMAERYTYVPFLGLFIVIVWLIADAVAKSPNLKIAAQLLTVVVLAACAIKTDARVLVWKDSITLFSDALQIDPRGELPNLSLGMAYIKQQRAGEAQPYLERALIYDPNQSLALAYSALCLMQPTLQSGDRTNLPLAGERLEKALNIAPNDPDVLTNLALWSSLMNRPADEETYSRRAIAAKPGFIPARLYLGEALAAQNKLPDAVEAYRQALVIDPKVYQAHNELGNLFDRQGFTKEALNEFRLSLEIKPDQAQPHFEIGKIFAESHRLEDAAGEFSDALQFDPANPNVRNNLGVILFQLGRYEEAAQQFGYALRVDPSNPNANEGLAASEARMNAGKK